MPEWTKGADCKSAIRGFESHSGLSLDSCVFPASIKGLRAVSLVKCNFRMNIGGGQQATGNLMHTVHVRLCVHNPPIKSDNVSATARRVACNGPVTQSVRRLTDYIILIRCNDQ